MLPTLWPGDLLTVQSLGAEEVEPGEIVLYMRSDRFFVHRIVSKNLGSGQCVADYPGRLHVRRMIRPIGRSELLGKVTEVQRSGLDISAGAKAFAHPPASGVWCFVTGVCSGALDCGSGITAAMARSKVHSSEQHQ